MNWSTTRGSDIVLWMCSEGGTPSSCLDGLAVGFSGDGLNHAMRLLQCCLALVLISIYFIAFSRPRREHWMCTRAALRALLTIVVPTCSLWPSRYIKLASVPRSRIGLPLEMIVEDATSGVIEFRNPIHDLADLIGSGAVVNGHIICITVGWKWWVSYFEWWTLVKSKSAYLLELLPGDLSDRVKHDVPFVYPNPLGLRLPLSALDASTSFCLDHFPNGTIPSLDVGCKATLEFTAFSLSLQALSMTQIISAAPFILSERFPRRPRTLVSVLKQLGTSCGPNIVVDSISNISADREHTLRYVHGSFFGEQKVRDRWVKNLGIRAWRREMFLVALEAALLRRGWIERWAVQVTAK